LPFISLFPAIALPYPSWAAGTNSTAAPVSGRSTETHAEDQPIAGRRHRLHPGDGATMRELAAVHRGVEAGDVPRAVIGRDDQGQPVLHGVLAGETEQPFRRSVPGRDLRAGVERDDGVVRGRYRVCRQFRVKAHRRVS
jgi:hypothetical protein